MLRFVLPLIVGLCCLTNAAAMDDPMELTIPDGLKKLRIPPDNPMTEGKVALGRQLFFDPRLSHDNSTSCATCHDPGKGWSNGESFATGVRSQVGARGAPTIVNAAYQYFQFWDGRAAGLEEQALGPIQNPIEMDLSLEELEKKLNSIEGYRVQFEQVFGGQATAENIAQAIATFERTILSGDAPYDRFKAGDTSALSEAAQRGMHLFFNVAQCSSCHAGSNFTDGGFHNIGIGMDKDEIDHGRFEITGLEGDRGSFKTPTLREISSTAPYMHDGRFATLDEVAEFYNGGGIANPQRDEGIFQLGLTAEQKHDLVTFLNEALSSDSYPAVETPHLPD